MFTKEKTNFCKGIAIIMMLFHHLFNDFEEYAGHPVDYRPFTGERLMFLALLCKVCVAVFVFLSGYGIAAVYEKKYGDREPVSGELIRFSWNRYWKLMTGYWFVFVLALLCQPLGRTVTDAYGGITGKAPILYFLIDVLGLSYQFSTPTLNPTWWYMTVAVFVIFAAPFLTAMMKKYGAAAVTAVVMGVVYLTGVTNATTFYVFSLLLGVACQELRFFEKLEKLVGGSRSTEKRILLSAVEVLAFFVLLSYRTDYNMNGIVDGLLALTLASAVHTFLIRIPVLSPVMCYLGKHSANMFLCHTLLYSYYFLGFFFSFRYWVLIVLSLVVVSLLVSIAIEAVKEKTGYNRGMRKLGDRIYSAFH